MAPILLMIVFVSIDLGRSIMVLDLLNHAARQGCRVGVLPGNGNSDITNGVNTSLDNVGIKVPQPPGIDVLPLGSSSWESPGNAGNAKTGDAIRVTVSISYKNVTWLAFNWFMDSKAKLSGTVVMCKE